MPHRELRSDPQPVLLRRWALEQFEVERTIHEQRTAAKSLTVNRWRRYASPAALSNAPAAEAVRAAGLEAAQAVAESPGDRRLRRFLEALRKLDEVFPRSPFQRKVHHSMMASFLPHIYGDDFVRNMARIFQKFGIDALNLWGLIACPRRYGKTMAVAMAMAAFLCTQPGKKVCIYSPSRRASRMMLATIFNMIKIIRGDSSDIVAMNQEELSLRHAEGAISTCNSYPSNVRAHTFHRRVDGTHPPPPSHSRHIFFLQWPSGPRRCTCRAPKECSTPFSIASWNASASTAAGNTPMLAPMP
jgi:hypothetical protein